MDNYDEIRLQILRELSKCSFCGLCEWVCPVLRIQIKRNYGPRGRVNSILFQLREGLWTKAGEEGIFTCLLCGACSTQCPAGVDIENSVRLFRYYLSKKGIP